MKKIRYAVVGLGYISQGAMLPAFKHAASNSELAALVTDDPIKAEKIGKMYGITHTYSYKEFDACLKSGLIDAIYIGTPNTEHTDFTVRAAKAGIHVLCEKAMAATEKDCQAMIDAAQKNSIHLMIAYRLHLDAATLKAIEIIQSGKIGVPRFFNACFSQQIKPGDVRLQKKLAGGSLYDMGVYCTNAARYLFRDEPYEVYAAAANNGEARFREVDEMTAVTFRFPKNRLATFTSSFGAADTSYARVVGTKGDLVLEPAYDFTLKLGIRVTVNGKSEHTVFPKTDQFAAQLIYFSNCILKNKKPEMSGEEGLADIRVIEAINKSVIAGRPVAIRPLHRQARPKPSMKITRPPIVMPTLIHAAPPSKP